MRTIQATSPGFTPARRASAVRSTPAPDERSVVQRHEQQRRTRVLRERQRRADDRIVGAGLGGTRERLVSKIDVIDDVDHRLERHTRARCVGGAVATARFP